MPDLLNQPIKIGRTPAFRAAEIGNVEVLQALATLGSDLKIKDNCGLNLAHIAALMGRIEVLRELKRLSPDLLNETSDEGATPAFIAAQEGRVPVLQTLYDLGIDVNKPLEDRTTPVHVAVVRGHLEVLQKLKQLKADFKLANRAGMTAAHLAVVCNAHKELIELLIDSEVDFSFKCRTTKADIEAFSKNKGDDVQQKVQKFIASFAENAPILLSPLEFAQLMGNNEIIALWEKKLKSSKQDQRLFSPAACQNLSSVDPQLGGAQPGFC